MQIESILFKDVDLFLAEGRRQGDVLVKNGKIDRIEPSITAPAELTLKEKGLSLIPGAIDTHVHLREPGAEHKETLNSGSKAAASGGITTFFDMPNNKPSAIDAQTIAWKKQRAKETSLINYNFYIGATTENLNELNNTENVAGIKIFMGSSTGNLLVDKTEDLDRIFGNGQRLIAVHAEDEAMVKSNEEKYKGETDPVLHYVIRNPEAALKATKLAVSLSEKYKRRLHILHLTTEEEALYLAKHKPATVTTEVCIQHLLLSGPECYKQLGNCAVINPPIRDERHRQALWKALKAGVIESIITDHAPHTLEEKAKPYGQAPSGMPGLETSVPLMLTQAEKGLCSHEDVIRWMCTNPARLFGIPNKGQIKLGYDADLVLVDLKKRWKIENKNQVTKCAWSAFDGWEVIGKPIATFVNGNQVYREGEFFEGSRGKEVVIRA